jgi:hypothetical protein
MAKYFKRGNIFEFRTSASSMAIGAAQLEKLV